MYSFVRILFFLFLHMHLSVFVMLFFKIGELFEGYAVGKSRKSISQLMEIRPDIANVEKDGKIIEVDPQDVKKGDIIIVKPGGSIRP